MPQVSTRCSVPAKESQAQAKHEKAGSPGTALCHCGQQWQLGQCDGSSRSVSLCPGGVWQLQEQELSEGGTSKVPYADCSRQLHVYCRTTCNVVGMYEHVLLCRVGRISSALPSWKGLVVYGVSVGRYWHENAMDVRVVGRGPTPVAASIACTGAGWC